MSLLSVQHLSKYFGGLAANTDISFEIEQGEIVGVIGPNGAGKSTLFNCVAGFYAPSKGRILLDGHDVTGCAPHVVARLGLARTFQVYAAGGDLTVLENVTVGAFMHTSSRSQGLRRADELLELFELSRYREALLSEIPVAAQKLVTMATALATRPRLLLLDEVAAGLNPSELAPIVAGIRRIHEELGVTVMLIEHILKMVMSLSHRVLVLDYGRLISQGAPQDVAADPEVIKAYLGEHYAEKMARPGRSA